MRDVATLRFSDPTIGGEFLAIIRAVGSVIGLACLAAMMETLRCFWLRILRVSLIMALQTALEMALPGRVMHGPEG